MYSMRWGIAVLMVLNITTAPAWADVVCTNESTAVLATTPTAEFTLHDNGTVTHTRTGLIWMRCSLGQTWTGSHCTGGANSYRFRNALNAVQDFNNTGGFAGHTDWRLPNKNELASILELRCWEPAINAAVFPNTPADVYWSSSPYVDSSTRAWSVNFHTSPIVRTSSKLDSSPRVRLVRGGQ